MEITNENVGDAVVARFEGSLDTTTAPQALSRFDALIDDGESTIVSELSPVDFVSSAGLRSLPATA